MMELESEGSVGRGCLFSRVTRSGTALARALSWVLSFSSHGLGLRGASQRQVWPRGFIRISGPSSGQDLTTCCCRAQTVRHV